MAEQDLIKLKQVVVQAENDANSTIEEEVTLRHISPTHTLITPPQFSDEPRQAQQITPDEVNWWIENNIKMRTCCHIIHDSVKPYTSEEPNVDFNELHINVVTVQSTECCKCGHQLGPSSDVHAENLADGLGATATSLNANGTSHYGGSNRTANCGGAWRSDDEFTIEQSTNAFGYLRFQHTSEIISQNVLDVCVVYSVGYPNDAPKQKRTEIANLVSELLLTKWSLPKPKLIMSIMGGTGSFTGSNRQQRRFKRAIITTAIKTGAWITTSGTYCGIMKHVGKAIRDYRMDTNSQPVVVIGIVPWGKVNNRQALLNSEEHLSPTTPKNYLISLDKLRSTQEEIREASKRGKELEGEKYQPYLEPNHTHFILVDDGTEDRWDTECDLRARLEAQLGTSCGVGSIVMRCVIAVEGGPGTLEGIRDSLRQSTPVVLVTGFGRVTDLLAFALQRSQPSSKIEGFCDSAPQEEHELPDTGLKFKMDANSMEQLQEMIGSLLPLTLKNRSKMFKEIGENVLCCLKYRSLICVVNSTADTLSELDPEEELKTAMLIAVLKSAMQKTQAKSRESLLTLALVWNRFDIARQFILNDPNNCLNSEPSKWAHFGLDCIKWPVEQKLTRRQLEKLMVFALENDRVDFIHDFEEREDIVKHWLTSKVLADLFCDIINCCSSCKCSALHALMLRKFGPSAPRRASQLPLQRIVSAAPDERVTVHEALCEVLSSSIPVAAGLMPIVRMSHSSDRQLLRKMGEIVVELLDDSKGHPYLELDTSDETDYSAVLAKNREFEDPNFHIFQWAVLQNKKKLAFLYWEQTREPLGTALYAVCLTRAMACHTTPDKREERQALLTTADEFERAAIGLFEYLSEANSALAHRLLVRAMPLLGGRTVLALATRAHALQFIANPTCLEFFSDIWNGNICEYMYCRKLRIFSCLICPPLIPLVIIFKNKDYFDWQSITRKNYGKNCPAFEVNVNQFNDVRSSETAHQFQSLFFKLRSFYYAPSIKYWNSVIFYSIFLTFFSLVLLTRFDPYEFGWDDIVLSVWVTGCLCELIQSRLFDWMEVRKTLSSQFFSNYFGWIYFMSILLFIPGIFWAISEALSIQMMQMVNMALIALVLLVGFGVTEFALLFPRSRLSGWLVRDVILLPYWQMHMNLYQDKVLQAPPFDMSQSCTNDEEKYGNYEELRCSDRNTSWITMILISFFVLITNIVCKLTRIVL